MITSTVTYLGELRTEGTHLASQQNIITDAPTDNNGKGGAFSPTDLLATSLASCMLTIVGMVSERDGFSIKGTKAEVNKVMASDPRRVSEIKINLYFPDHHYSEKQKQVIKNAALSCPVAKSLHPEILQKIEFNF